MSDNPIKIAEAAVSTATGKQTIVERILQMGALTTICILLIVLIGYFVHRDFGYREQQTIIIEQISETLKDINRQMDKITNMSIEQQRR